MDVLLYLLSIAYDAGDACTRDVDVRTYLRGSCEHGVLNFLSGAPFFCI